MGLSILLAQNLYEDERKYTFNIVTCVATMFLLTVFLSYGFYILFSLTDI